MSTAIWFAKGYGPRASPIGDILKERLGPQAVVFGANSEGGLLADGREVQEETFALGALVLVGGSLKSYPFHGQDLLTLPKLLGNIRWDKLQGSPNSPQAALAVCPMPAPGEPQCWLGILERALSGSRQAPVSPVIVGGLPIGGPSYVDSEALHGGSGLLLRGHRGVRLDPVVCQGAEPFGPWLTVTGVQSDDVITSLDGQSPREVLEPLLHGPEVPGQGQSMAGIFVDPVPMASLPEAAARAVAQAALGGRPSCLVRPMHAFTADGHLVLSPLPETMPYREGMKFQLHCFSPKHALSNLRGQAEHDMALNGGPPDAAVVISCGARGVSLYGTEGVESQSLREVWGREVPLVGFFAGGEIGPVGLKSYLHSYTTSCLMLRFTT